MKELDAATRAFRGDSRFSGQVEGVHISVDQDPQLHAYVVSFEPGSRTAWHFHERGQLLICTSGFGYVGTRDGRRISLRPGRAVWTEPGEEHWHGAGPHDVMSHIAVQTETPGAEAVHWLEPVSEGECRTTTA